MADQQPLVEEHSPQETLVYRPVSGLAVAGLILAGLYTGILLFTTVVAFFQGTPFFLPGWLLLMPIGGVLLSLLGQWHIRLSEGTRAGIGLTRWGLWLSVFTGVGYFAYHFFTGLALAQQANAFLLVQDADSGFFPRLQEGTPLAVNAAFLLTMPPTDRGGTDPSDIRQINRLFNRSGPKGPGMLTQFRQHYLVRTIVRSGANVQIEPLGVQSWSYQKGGYLVVRNYRVTTPEAVFLLGLPVYSSEAGQRKWFLDITKAGMKVQFTPLGVGLKNHSSLAQNYLEGKINDLARGLPLTTFPDKTEWTRVVVQGAPWKALREEVENIFLKPREGFRPPIQVIPEEYLPRWEVVQGRLQFLFSLNLTFLDRQETGWRGEGTVRVECQEPVTVDERNIPNPGSFPPLPTWKIVGIEFSRFQPMSMKGP